MAMSSSDPTDVIEAYVQGLFQPWQAPHEFMVVQKSFGGGELSLILAVLIAVMWVYAWCKVYGMARTYAREHLPARGDGAPVENLMRRIVKITDVGDPERIDLCHSLAAMPGVHEVFAASVSNTTQIERSNGEWAVTCTECGMTSRLRPAKRHCTAVHSSGCTETMLEVTPELLRAKIASISDVENKKRVEWSWRLLKDQMPTGSTVHRFLAWSEVPVVACDECNAWTYLAQETPAEAINHIEKCSSFAGYGAAGTDEMPYPVTSVCTFCDGEVSGNSGEHSECRAKANDEAKATEQAAHAQVSAEAMTWAESADDKDLVRFIVAGLEACKADPTYLVALYRYLHDPSPASHADLSEYATRDNLGTRFATAVLSDEPMRRHLMIACLHDLTQMMGTTWLCEQVERFTENAEQTP